MTTTNTAGGFGRNQITQIVVSQLFTNILTKGNELVQREVQGRLQEGAPILESSIKMAGKFSET